jgi:hypothetical protein
MSGARQIVAPAIAGTHIRGMKPPATRIAVITAAVVLGAATLGCGALSQAKQAVDNLSTVADLAQKLGNSDKLTFTAEYRLPEGAAATVVQQPPNVAVIGKDGRFIYTADALYLCDKKSKPATCQKTANTSAGADMDQTSAAYLSAVAGAGFVSAPYALVILTAASVAPGAKVDKSEKKIAGLNSICLHVTGVPADNDPKSADLKEFTACVADNGLLTLFSGTDTGGTTLSVEMTRYSDTADANAFKPPAGYQVIDVDQLQPNKQTGK